MNAHQPDGLEEFSKDAILQFLAPNESAKAFWARSYAEPLATGIPFLDAQAAVSSQGFLQIVGPPGSGKTELALQAAVTAMLPKAWRGCDLAGWAGHVLYVDADARFDFKRLLHVLDDRLQHKLPLELHDELHTESALCTDTLQRFHLFTCHSTVQLLATLDSLPRWLASHKVDSPTLLLLDSLGAFYGLDRACKNLPEAMPGGPSSGVQNDVFLHSLHCVGYLPVEPLTLQRAHLAMVSSLQRLRREHKVSVIATAPAAPVSDETGLAVRETLPNVWQTIVTRKLAVSLQQSDGLSATIAARWLLPCCGAQGSFCVHGGTLS